MNAGQVAEKFAVEVKSLYSKINRKGDRIVPGDRTVAFPIAQHLHVDETLMTETQPSVTDDGNTTVIPCTAGNDSFAANSDVFVQSTVVADHTMDKSAEKSTEEEKEKSEDGDEEASHSTFGFALSFAGSTLGSSKPKTGPLLPPGDPKVTLYAGQAMVYWARSPSDTADREIQYAVYLCIPSSKSWDRQNGQKPLLDNSININNLWPGKEYEVHVTAVEGEDESVASVSEPFQLTGEELER